MTENEDSKSRIILPSLKEEERARLANRLFDVILFSLKTDQIPPPKARKLVELYREESLSSKEGLELLVELAEKYEPDLASKEILSLSPNRKTDNHGRPSQ